MVTPKSTFKLFDARLYLCIHYTRRYEHLEGLRPLLLVGAVPWLFPPLGGRGHDRVVVMPDGLEEQCHPSLGVLADVNR